jgi:hypothetical protein
MSNNPKKQLTLLERALKAGEKALDKLRQEEAKSRARWTRKYHQFMRNSKILASVTDNMCKTALAAKKVIADWQTTSGDLTVERDQWRGQINAKEEELQKIREEMAGLRAQLSALDREDDSIVHQVFALNDSVVAALEQRDSFVSQNVYGRLLDDDGSMRTQLTIDSSDGLRRVVAMVNTITKIKPDLADMALTEIERFFARFTEATEMDEATRILFDLTSNLLIEKTSFQVGPDMYRFLSLELDECSVPELKKAQMLLRKSLRSEKTNTYIRLYGRDSRTDNWVPVRLS